MSKLELWYAVTFTRKVDPIDGENWIHLVKYDYAHLPNKEAAEEMSENLEYYGEETIVFKFSWNLKGIKRKLVSMINDDLNGC